MVGNWLEINPCMKIALVEIFLCEFIESWRGFARMPSPNPFVLSQIYKILILKFLSPNLASVLRQIGIRAEFLSLFISSFQNPKSFSPSSDFHFSKNQKRSEEKERRKKLRKQKKRKRKNTDKKQIRKQKESGLFL